MDSERLLTDSTRESISLLLSCSANPLMPAIAESAFSTTPPSLPETSARLLMNSSISPLLPLTLPVIADALAITFFKSDRVLPMLRRFSSESTSFTDSTVVWSLAMVSSNFARRGPMLAEMVSTRSASEAAARQQPLSASFSDVPQSMRMPLPPIMLVL